MTVAAKKATPSPLRAKIHIAKKQLGLNDEEYQALLIGETGKSSTAEMTNAQMIAVLGRCKELGWNPIAPAPPKSAHTAPESRWLLRPSNWEDKGKNPMYKKLYAMICANQAKGWNWGYVRGTARKMFQNSKPGGDVVLEFLTGAELHAVVAALQIQSTRNSRGVK